MRVVAHVAADILFLQHRHAAQLLRRQQALIEPVQGPLIADGVAVAAGEEFFQHLLLIAGVVAMQALGVEQRLQGRVAVAQHGADGLMRQVRRIDRGGARMPGDQQVGLGKERDAPEEVAGLVGQPRLRGITADIDLAVVHGVLHPCAGQHMELGRYADLGREAEHHIKQDALGRFAPFQLHHGHGPAVGYREAQRRISGYAIQADQQQCPQGQPHKRSVKCLRCATWPEYTSAPDAICALLR
ncbi:hypothetical protein D3C76_979840 [compost metagenome]